MSSLSNSQCIFVLNSHWIFLILHPISFLDSAGSVMVTFGF